MSNPFEENEEKELDAWGRPKGKFDRRLNEGKNPHKKEAYNPFQSKYKTSVHLQIRDRNLMSTLPIAVIAYIKLLYTQRRTWAYIHQSVKQKFPSMKDITEERVFQVFNNNKEEFRQAREEYEKKIQEEFSDDRKRLLSTTLTAELELAEKYHEEINKLKKALDRTDPSDPDQSKHYSILITSLEKVQKQLEKLTNTDRFRRLEEQRAALEQKKAIMGDIDDEGKEKAITGVNIIGAEQ